MHRKGELAINNVPAVRHASLKLLGKAVVADTGAAEGVDFMRSLFTLIWQHVCKIISRQCSKCPS